MGGRVRGWKEQVEGDRKRKVTRSGRGRLIDEDGGEMEI